MTYANKIWLCLCFTLNAKYIIAVVENNKAFLHE